MRISTRALVLGLMAATALVPAKSAVAGGFGNRLQSPIGAGEAFAGAGTSSYDLSGMFWNPAAVNLADGFMYQSSWTLAMPRSDIHAISTDPFLTLFPQDSGDISIDALVPGSFGAYRINPNWAVGFSVNAPFGLATKANTPWAGQFYAITARAAVIDVAGVIGYSFNNWIDFAAGPRVVYAKARFSRDVSPLPGIQAATLSDLEDVGYGWEAGVNIRPWAGGEIALGYRSRVDLSLGGNLDSPLGRLPVTGDVTLPGPADTEPRAADRRPMATSRLGGMEELEPCPGRSIHSRRRGRDGHHFDLPLQGRLELRPRRGISMERCTDAARRPIL